MRRGASEASGASGAHTGASTAGTSATATSPSASAASPSAAATASAREPELAIDPIACVGHGLCAELFPEGVVLDDWGFPIVLPEASDPALREHARRAVAACPALALRLRTRGA